jgi:hypothetical protein
LVAEEDATCVLSFYDYLYIFRVGSYLHSHRLCIIYYMSLPVRGSSVPVVEADVLQATRVAAAVLKLDRGGTVQLETVAAAQLAAHEPVRLAQFPVVVLRVQGVCSYSCSVFLTPGAEMSVLKNSPSHEAREGGYNLKSRGVKKKKG